MSFVPLETIEKYMFSNEYMYNKNKIQHVMLRVFKGEKADNNNLDFQLGFYCKYTISHLTGSECKDCWYLKKNGVYGCNIDISYKDFCEFAEDSNVREYKVTNSFFNTATANIYKTNESGIFVIILFTCKNSIDYENKQPYHYILTTKKVKEFVINAKTIQIYGKGKGKTKSFQLHYNFMHKCMSNFCSKSNYTDIHNNNRIYTGDFWRNVEYIPITKNVTNVINFNHDEIINNIYLTKETLDESSDSSSEQKRYDKAIAKTKKQIAKKFSKSFATSSNNSDSFL